MHRSSRHHEILNLLQKQPVVTVSELTDRLGASKATVRRDIGYLAERELLRRVHGGAERLSDHPDVLHGKPLNISQSLHIAEKKAIGREAANLCRSGDSLNINGGSTTAMMARFLPTMDLHILTNALPIADYLIGQTRNRVSIPGGEVFREQNIVLSPFEEDATDKFRADLVFLGAQSIGPSGLMESDFILIQAVRNLMQHSEKVVGLVDSSKFRARGNLVLCGLDAIDILVTDSGITKDDLTIMKDAEIDVRVVQADTLSISA